MLDVEMAVGTENISSARLSRLSGFSAPQVRRDLAYFGSFGKRGVGYSVSRLREELGSILGTDQPRNITMVGVGNLGRALLAYKGFDRHGTRFAVAFDTDVRKIGSTVAGVPVEPLSDLDRLVQEHAIELALIAVPGAAAQDVVDSLVAAGIKAILNFAPRALTAPKDVKVTNVDLAVEVEYLSYLLANG
jgi:redox-sensing transcriptional repressor